MERGTLAKEFPDYPAADIPAVPSFMLPAFWRNDTCPVWRATLDNGAELIFAADYADPELREVPDAARFSVHYAAGDHSPAEVFASDDIGESMVALWAVWIGLGYHPDTRAQDYTPQMNPADCDAYDATHAAIDPDRAAEIGLGAWESAGLIPTDSAE